MTAPPPTGRVLVVDDDPGMLHSLGRILGRPYQVATAASAGAALELLKRFEPDLAVVDIRLPETSGFELMRQLRQRDAALDVILMTGNAEDPDGTLVRAIDEGAFYFIAKPFERRVLLALVARCLELRRLRTERQRSLLLLRHELAEAREFQRSLFPPEHQVLAGAAISARYLASNELAGDFFDYAAAPEGAAALLVVDVVGHGASAAMMTALVKSAFQAAHGEGFHPEAVAARVQDGIRTFEADRFVTLCCARLEADGRLRFVNAGHPPALLHRAAGPPALLEGNGPLITSALADFPYRADTIELGPGDRVLFYTDGLIEADGPAGNLGLERLETLFHRSRQRGPALLDDLLSALAAFSLTPTYRDDVTLLLLERA